MKKSMLILSLVCLGLTSCLKDGLNDFDALNHDMSINGTVNPTLGVPIGHGAVSVYDLLNMVQLSTATLEITDQDVVTITYDTSMHFRVDLDDSKADRPATKDGSDIVHVSRNSVGGAVNIDLFDNITLIDTADIEVDSLLVYLLAHVKARTYDSLQSVRAMEDFHVQVYYNNLVMTVVGQDDHEYQVVSKYTRPGDSLSIANLLHGEDVLLFDNEDISNAINKRPKQIKYTAQMNIAFTAAFFATSGISENQFVADSIGVKIVDIDADLKARFPISAFINNLQYAVDINLERSVELDKLSIDSSAIYIECKNGIPLELTLNAQFLDANGDSLCSVLDADILGADVALDASNLYSSTGQKTSIVEIPITKFVFDNLLLTRTIRLTAGLKTSPTGNPARNRVAIKSQDRLDLRVWAKLQPYYPLDFSTGNSEEGGAR